MTNVRPLLRVKRKRWEDPAEAFLISAKKRRGESNGSGQTLFRFVATLEEDSEEAARSALESRGEQLRSKWKSAPTASPKQKRQEKRNEKQAAVAVKRYKLVSRQRDDKQKSDCEAPAAGAVSTMASEHDTEEVHRLFQLYDIIEEEELTEEKKSALSHQREAKPRREKLEVLDPEVLLCNSVAMIREKLEKACHIDQEDSSSVYDLYFPIDEANFSLDNDIQVEMLNDPKHYFQSFPDDDCPQLDDEDDSNDELNWRNDYPDEENGKSYQSSSEDEDEDFYVESRRYDLSYKLWKKRVTRETGLAGCGRDALGDENDFEDDSPPLCGDREEYSFFGQT